MEPHSLDNSDEIYEYVFFYHIFSKKETLNDKDINKLKDIMYNRRQTLNNTLTINLKGQIINIDGELKNDDIKNNLEKEENKKTKLEIERFVEELNLLSTDIFSNLKEYIKHISYLKNKINEFFEKVVNLFTVLNEILDEEKKIDTIQTRRDYIQITEYMNNIHIYEIFMNKKKLPIAILNMMIEELSISKSNKSVKYAQSKRVMKLEEKKEEKEKLKEKEKDISFGKGDIVKLTSDKDITDKIKIKKNQEFLKNFIIIDIDITGKKFTVKELDGEIKIADVPLNHIRAYY